jgi:selenocysteine-specific elongation factor
LSASLLIGTAGHIDHGKTSLVRALTGVDTDRLPEEKARGISIELGFAQLRTAAGDTIGVVDVPGHERFVRTMVAGATGIDMALVVIAADEGVMPQTREHLDICGLLGIPRGMVALTKSDLIDGDGDWLALVTEDVRRALRGTFLEKAAIVPCSATTGAGLPELRAEIERLATGVSPRPADGPLRLPLDRAFTLKGFGTVVTGTLASGVLRVEEEVIALPDDGRGPAATRVRRLEVHGCERSEAHPGQRTAANLQGIHREALGRGAVLGRPGEMQPSSIVDVELSLLPICPAPMKTRAKVLFHALTTQESAIVVLMEGAHLGPGGRALAQVHLARPIALLPGDRFILRGFRTLAGYGTTIGGGRVVRVLAPRRRRGDETALTLARRFAAAASLEERVALEIEGAGPAGIDRAGIRARTGDGSKGIDKAVEALLSRRAAITTHRETGAVVSAAAVAPFAALLTAALDRFHEAEPLRAGIAREELRTASARTRALDPRVFAVVLSELQRAGAIEVEQELVRRKGFSPRRAESQHGALLERGLALYREAGLAPPWSNDLPEKIGASPADSSAVLEALIRRGDLVRVKADLCFDRTALDALRERLREELARQGQITAQQWKELTGQTRKYAIPLAEHFDAEKVTLRVGEVRKLRG